MNDPLEPTQVVAPPLNVITGPRASIDASIDPPLAAVKRGPTLVTKLFLGLGILLVIAGIVGMYVKLPYVIFSPGDATGVDQYITIKGARSYQHRGELFLLTVRVSNGRPNLWRYLEAALDDDSKVLGEKKYYGKVPPKRVQQASVQMMDESELAAKSAALTKLGYQIILQGKGARVLQVVDESPAARAGLRPNDVVVSIDGAAVSLRDQVGAAVQRQPVGTTFAVGVEHNAKLRTVEVTSVAAPSGPLRGKPFFGIGANTEQLRVKFPVDIVINAGEVSGPSGGLAFTLTIIDKLTPGDLTGGAKVAVTGEIDAAGNVGEVGGVPQKAVAARAAGATLMIVPVPEVKDARSKAGSMKVVGVRTLDEALAALARNGGAPLPKSR